jgi:hypothetical protein
VSTPVAIPYPALNVPLLAADIAVTFGNARRAAHALGVAESTIRRILYGESRNPTILHDLARALGHDPARYRLEPGRAHSSGVRTLPGQTTRRHRRTPSR